MCGGASVAESNSNSTATGMQRSTANKRTVQLTAEQQHKPGPQRRTRLHDVGSKVVVSGALVALGHPCEAHAVPKPGKHAAEGRQAGRQINAPRQLAWVACEACVPQRNAAGQLGSQSPLSQPQPLTCSWCLWRPRTRTRRGGTCAWGSGRCGGCGAAHAQQYCTVSRQETNRQSQQAWPAGTA